MNRKVIFTALALLLVPFNSYAISTEVKDDDVILYDYSFPIKMEDYDDSILTNTTYKFYGDENIKDQVTVSDYKNAQIFINGEAVDSNEKANELVKKGKNSIDVLDVTGPVDVKLKSGKDEAGFEKNTNKLDKNTTDFLETLINEEVKENFAGGQITVIRDNEEVYNYNFGYVNNFDEDGKPIPVENRVKVTENTLFDLASNTKMYATNYILQKLVYEGQINLDSKVSNFFPEFTDSETDPIKGKDTMTIRDILKHQAGFPADPQYHNDTYDKDDGIENGKNDLFSQDRNKTLEMVLKTPLAYQPGSKSVYSDVDYMILGFIIEQVTGQRLDQYYNDNFAKPLGLTHTVFNPLKNGFMKDQTAATELNGNTRDGKIDFVNVRKDTVQGEVHDEKAFYAMEGISGHAGLFSNSRELARLANIMLNDGVYNGVRFWDKKTQDEFTTASTVNPSYGLGWRRMADGRYGWAFSNLASENAIGHTGWTGTLTVIDPLERLTFVMLTNKKNGPVLDKEKNPNKFYPDTSMTAGYGAVSTLVYKSLQENSDELIKAYAKELEQSQKRMLKERKDYINVAEFNDYLAIQRTRELINEKYQAKAMVENSSKKEAPYKANKETKVASNKAPKANAKASNNPKTGIASLIPVISLLATSVFAFKRTNKQSC